MRIILKILLCLASAAACLACSEQGLGRDPVQFLGKVAEGSFSIGPEVHPAAKRPATRPGAAPIFRKTPKN